VANLDRIEVPQDEAYCFSIGKDEVYKNEDRFAQSQRNGRYAVSDGASNSYNSALWAELLVRAFCRNADVDEAWLKAAISKYEGAHNRDAMSWSQQMAFDRGSFASLLGITLDKQNGFARLIGIGDSTAFLVDSSNIVATFPYTSPDQFLDDPVLLGTDYAQDMRPLELIAGGGALTKWEYGSLSLPSILLASDALAHWILRTYKTGFDPISHLRKCRSKKQFKHIISDLWEQHELKKDDATMLWIELSHVSANH
jgi:hypothetical protein